MGRPRHAARPLACARREVTALRRLGPSFLRIDRGGRIHHHRRDGRRGRHRHIGWRCRALAAQPLARRNMGTGDASRLQRRRSGQYPHPAARIAGHRAQCSAGHSRVPAGRAHFLCCSRTGPHRLIFYLHLPNPFKRPTEGPAIHRRSKRGHAHRHHLLSHLRRLGRGGHRAGHRAGRVPATKSTSSPIRSHSG